MRFSCKRGWDTTMRICKWINQKLEESNNFIFTSKNDFIKDNKRINSIFWPVVFGGTKYEGFILYFEILSNTTSLIYIYSEKKGINKGPQNLFIFFITKCMSILIYWFFDVHLLFDIIVLLSLFLKYLFLGW